MSVQKMSYIHLYVVAVISQDLTELTKGWLEG